MGALAKRPWRERAAERLRVHWSFLRVVLPRFKFSLLTFAVVNLLGSLVIWAERPELSFPHAVYAALALNFFEVADGYPQEGGALVQLTYFVIPAVGLTVIAESVVRLGVAIFHRKHLSKEWNVALAATFKDHVIVAGLGRIGLRVAQRLAGSEKLVCIEKVRPESTGLPETVAVLVGDATRLDVLEQANVAQARALLALTDNDLVNLEMALNAREVNPELRVVLRMFNETLGRRLVQQFGFQAVYSTSALAAPSFAAALYSSKILQTIEVGFAKTVHMAQVEVQAGSSLVGRTILEVEREAGVSVVLHHTSEHDDLLPSADAKVAAGDGLYVLAELKDLDRFDGLASAKA